MLGLREMAGSAGPRRKDSGALTGLRVAAILDRRYAACGKDTAGHLHINEYEQTLPRLLSRLPRSLRRRTLLGTFGHHM